MDTVPRLEHFPMSENDRKGPDFPFPVVKVTLMDISSQRNNSQALSLQINNQVKQD